MFAHSVTARVRAGSEADAAKFLRQRAAELFRAPGCYAANVLTDLKDGSLTLISYWVDLERRTQATAAGALALPAEWFDGPGLERTFHAEDGVGPEIPLATHFGIRVTDLDRSLRFYTELLGFEVIHGPREDPDLHSKVAILRNPRTGLQLGLNWYTPGGAFGAPFVAGEALDHIGLRVADIPRFLETAQKAGATIADLRPHRGFPYQSDGGAVRVAYLSDPDGNTVEIYDVAGYALDAPFGGEF